MRALAVLVLFSSTAIAGPTPVDPKSLTAWDIPAKVKNSGQATEVYAVDVDGGRLLGMLADTNYIIKPVNQKITGRVSAPSQRAAFATVAAKLGVDITPPVLKGSGATVDLWFAGAPVVDLFRILADTGRVNVVVQGDLPDTVDIRVKRVSWDAVLTVVVSTIDRTMFKAGNVRYVVAKDTKLLPPLPKSSTATVSLDVKNGTAAHAIAALREVTPLKLFACESKPFTLRVKRVSLAEALRAISIVSGVSWSETACKSSPFTGTSLDDMRLVAVAEAGTKRAAALDRKGEVLIATKTDKVDVGQGFVAIGDKHVMLYPYPDGVRDEDLKYVRTAALVRIGQVWRALVESKHGLTNVDGSTRNTIVKADGVRVLEDNGTETLVPFGK